MRKVKVAFLFAVLLVACQKKEEEPPNIHPAHQIVETDDLPPVIKLEDLVPMGFDTTTIYAIEPHFALLNDALVVLAELKSSFDSTSDGAQRGRLNSYAIPFHLTGDRHQRMILDLLSPPLDSLFDSYVERRKQEVGLADWHVDHRQEGPATELPGLTRPEGRR